MIENFLYGVIHAFEWYNILYCVIGLIAGIIIGALPGLSVTLGVALMLPFTFALPATAGMLMLIGVYCGGVFGGSITAILLKTPGSAASAATAVDGFALAQQGKAGQALNVSLYASVAGGLLSGVALLFIAPQIANFALKFGPPEYFALALFGLTVIAGVSGKSISKGMIMACLGLLIATVGLDPIQGVPRFTFGTNTLLSGIELVPALIGLFAISEIFNQIEKRSQSIAVNTTYEKQPFGWRQLNKLKTTILKSSIIGIIIGAIPGTGATISSYIAYNEARRKSKEPHRFGKGSMEGVAASEAGNNGTTGATLIPMMTLGIPGDVVTAVLLGSLLIQGLTPGPQLFKENGELVYTIMIGFILANIMMFFIGKVAIRWFARVANIPNYFLFPVVLGLCLIGTYAYSNSLNTVSIMLIFGVLGYFFNKYEYPVPPMLIGIILGPIAEGSIRQSLILSNGSPTIFLERPIALVFIILAIVSAVLLFIRNRRENKEQYHDTIDEMTTAKSS